jgi:hypothetical protein
MTKNGWHQSYEEAVLETDWMKMEERLQTAEADIQQRRLVLLRTTVEPMRKRQLSSMP